MTFTLSLALAASLQLSCAARQEVVTQPPLPEVAATPLVESPALVSAKEAERREREAILDLVRSHRRTTTDRWRNVLAEAVYTEAIAADVDPLMVASIVATESSFKSRVVSKAGAVGLMQLRPFVARDVARRSRQEWRGLETLHSPEMNVRLGVQYYKELVDRFGGDLEVALTAYNEGPTRVTKKLREGRYEGSRYASRILDLYQVLDTARTSPRADAT